MAASILIAARVVGINVRIVNPVDDDAEEEVPALPFVLRLVVEIGFGTGPRTDTGADNDDTAPDEDPDAIDDGPVVLVTMAADAAAYVIGAGTLAVLVATLRFLYLMGAGAAATGGRPAVPLFGCFLLLVAVDMVVICRLLFDSLSKVGRVGVKMMSIEGRLLLVVVVVVVVFTPSFLLLLLAIATLVLVPGVTGLLLNDGDTKSAFVLFIFMEIFVVPLVVEFCIFRSYIVSLEIGMVVPYDIIFFY